MDETMVKWAAGLIEGEGNVLQGKGGFGIQVSMTDQDVVESILRVFGVGNIHPRKLQPGCKQQWRWTVYGRSAYAVMVAIYPWLHSRRQAAVRGAIQRWLLVQSRQHRGMSV